MKKFISILLATLILTSLLTNISASAKVKTYRNNDYIYCFVDDGVQILHYVGKDTKVTVPSEIEGRKVVKLGADIDDKYYMEMDALSPNAGFYHHSDITEVILPNSIKEIGSGSFSQCKNLKKVTLGNGITEIPSSLFYYCPKLRAVEIPFGVEEIGDLAFSNCPNLKDIRLPSSVTEIDCDAFSGTGLTKFYFGKNVKYIGIDVFEDTPIKKITVSEENTKYSAENGVLYNKDKTKLYYYPSNKKEETFKVPKAVEKINVSAFSYNKNLKSLVVSKGVKKIGYNAFFRCTNLSKVTFKTTKEVKIGYCAFYNCKSLKKVTIPKNVKKIGARAFGFYVKKGKDGEYKLTKIQGFTIKGKSGSQAEKYAKQNGFKFVVV